MKQWIVISVPVAALGVAVPALVMAWRGADAPRTGEPAPAVQAAQAGLAEELSALREKVARLEEERREGARPPARTPAGTAAPGAAHDPEPDDPKSAPERARERLRASADGLQARFARERPDPAWSRATARQIEDAVAASAPGTKVRAADCGATLCRVVVEHATPEAQRSLGRALAKVEPFRAGVFYDYREDTTPPVTVIYVIREGESFREEAGQR